MMVLPQTGDSCPLHIIRDGAPYHVARPIYKYARAATLATIRVKIRRFWPRRCVVSPLGSSFLFSRPFHEFHCRECGNDTAYVSRPRGIIEKAMLSVLMLQAVRCDRCYHRSYAFRGVPARPHASRNASAKVPQGTSDTGTRVA